MEYMCEVKITNSFQLETSYVVEALTEGGALAKINNSLRAAFKDCFFVVEIKGVL